MKQISSIFILLICITLVSCSGGNEKTANKKLSAPSEYSMVMFDTTGVKVAEGKFNIVKYSDDRISGTYNFTNVITEFEGYKSMSGGEYTGKINKADNNLLINTNPGKADDNVFFSINAASIESEGIWYYTAGRKVSKSSIVKLTKITK